MRLSALIEPYSVDRFLDQVWTKDALHVPGPPDKFAGLFGWSDLNDILNRETEVGKIRMARAGQMLPPYEFTKSGSAPHRVVALPHRVIDLMRAGTTLVVDSIEHQVGSVARAVAELQSELGEEVRTNTYCSWPGAEGFGIHYDTHEVFIAQIAGRKRWTIFPMTEPYPLAQSVKGRAPDRSMASMVVELSAGDVLYVPRGHWHFTEAVAGPSLHLTIGIHCRTGLAVLRYLSRTVNGPLWRENLPLAFGSLARPDARARLQERLAALTAALADTITTPGVLDGFVSETEGSTLRPAIELPHQVEPQRPVLATRTAGAMSA
jgi:ribosomal protein L16 Arg81 hydroxylase